MRQVITFIKSDGYGEYINIYTFDVLNLPYVYNKINTYLKAIV